MLPSFTELPPGVYSAERGLSVGGMNEEPIPDRGEGGLNDDRKLSIEVATEGDA